MMNDKAAAKLELRKVIACDIRQRINSGSPTSASEDEWLNECDRRQLLEPTSSGLLRQWSKNGKP